MTLRSHKSKLLLLNNAEKFSISAGYRFKVFKTKICMPIFGNAVTWRKSLFCVKHQCIAVEVITRN